jgi:DNA repair exonuclease SbcCD ATPase subunit
MIIFEKIKYVNFLSVGANPVELDLEGYRSTLIVGKNGSGKSLLLDALSFVLFGKPHRGINKTQLVNSINGKGLLVEIWFRCGTKQYRVVRGQKPNIFEIWLDGEMLNQESHNRDYQKILETNILKLNHKSFHQVIVLGSGNFIPFMQLPQGQRRTVIEDLLDISIFSKMNILLKENQGKLKEQLRYTETQLESLREQVRLQHSHIEKLQKISGDNSDKLDAEIVEISSDIARVLEENSTNLQTYNLYAPDVKSKLEKQREKLAELHSLKNQIKLKYKDLQQQKTFYAEHTHCPTCTQDINDETRDKEISKCTHKATELETGDSQISKAISQVADKINSLTEKMNELAKLQNIIHANSLHLQNLEKRLSECKKSRDSITDSIAIESSRSELETLKNQRDNLSDLKSNLQDSRHYNDVVAEMLKDTGIKTKIIRQYLPVMNQLINNYLQILDFFVSFELDENFTETIRSRYRDDFSYASFSEGERARIDLSLLFAWRQISKMKNSANTNLLLFDEVFDGSLDGEGIENLFKIMETLDPSTRVFVISHNAEMQDGKFERKLEFEKVKNFTQLKTSSDL